MSSVDPLDVKCIILVDPEVINGETQKASMISVRALHDMCDDSDEATAVITKMLEQVEFSVTLGDYDVILREHQVAALKAARDASFTGFVVRYDDDMMLILPEAGESFASDGDRFFVEEGSLEVIDLITGDAAPLLDDEAPTDYQQATLLANRLQDLHVADEIRGGWVALARQIDGSVVMPDGVPYRSSALAASVDADHFAFVNGELQFVGRL